MKKIRLLALLLVCLSLFSCDMLPDFVTEIFKPTPPLALSLYGADGTVTDITDAKYDLVSNPEPGIFEVRYFSVTNNTDGELTYDLSLMITDVENNLLDVCTYQIVPGARLGDIDRTSGYTYTIETPLLEGLQKSDIRGITIPANSTDYYAILFYMDTTAGNEYQGSDCLAVLEVNSIEK